MLMVLYWVIVGFCVCVGFVSTYMQWKRGAKWDDSLLGTLIIIFLAVGVSRLLW